MGQNLQNKTEHLLTDYGDRFMALVRGASPRQLWVRKRSQQPGLFPGRHLPGRTLTEEV